MEAWTGEDAGLRPGFLRCCTPHRQMCQAYTDSPCFLIIVAATGSRPPPSGGEGLSPAKCFLGVWEGMSNVQLRQGNAFLREGSSGREAGLREAPGKSLHGGSLGCGGDPIYALLMAGGHFDLGQADQIPAGRDSLTGSLHFVRACPSYFLEHT